jgi:choline dehydrogenase
MGQGYWRRFVVMETICTVSAENTSKHNTNFEFLYRYFRKFEKYTPDTSYPLVDASFRGKDGPIRVGYFNHVSNASKQFIKACVSIGIPFTPDFNGSLGTIGVSRVSLSPSTY